MVYYLPIQLTCTTIQLRTAVYTEGRSHDMVVQWQWKWNSQQLADHYEHELVAKIGDTWTTLLAVAPHGAFRTSHIDSTMQLTVQIQGF